MANRTARAAGLFIIVYLVVPLAAASVYRCSDDRGVPLFSQYPCATMEDVETMAITSISVVPAAPLTRSEEATLERIQRDFQRSEASAARDQQRARRRNSQSRAESLALCARTRDALKSLRERKRSGYSLAKAEALAAEEAELRDQMEEHC